MIKKILGLSLFCVVLASAPCLGALAVTPPRSCAINEPSNVCKDVLNIINNAQNTQDAANKIKAEMRRLFLSFTCLDRRGVALPLENNDLAQKNRHFYKALGSLFAIILSQGCIKKCYFNEEYGQSFITFKKNKNNIRFTLLFSVKNSSDHKAINDQPFFKRKNNNVDGTDSVIEIYINRDTNSNNRHNIIDVAFFENVHTSTTSAVYNLCDGTELETEYKRDRNFLAQMIDGTAFDYLSIQMILNAIPYSLRNGAHENFFTCLLASLFRLLGNCDSSHQESTTFGTADNCIFVNNNNFVGYIIEVKLNKSAAEAIKQASQQYTNILERRFVNAESYGYLVGLNIYSDGMNELILSTIIENYTQRKTSEAVCRNAVPHKTNSNCAANLKNLFDNA